MKPSRIEPHPASASRLLGPLLVVVLLLGGITLGILALYAPLTPPGAATDAPPAKSTADNEPDTHGALRRALAAGDRSAALAAVTAMTAATIDRAAGGMTPLMRAAAAGEHAVVAALLASGADPNARGRANRTALQYATERNHIEIARMLLRFGADVDGHDDSRLTPLIMAADRGHTALARLLIRHGADVNFVHKAGWTPLIDAARTGNLELVGVLLEHGADAQARMPAGQTASDLAAQAGYSEIVRRLGTVDAGTPPPAAEPVAQVRAAADPAAAADLGALLLAGRYRHVGRDGNGQPRVSEITLSTSPDGLRWTNPAGVSWRLTRTGDRARLAVGADCPAYALGYREARVEWNDDGSVRRILGPHDAWYERVAE